jgi:hypothetical protein
MQVGASTAATARSLSAALSAQFVRLDLLLIEDVAHRASDPFVEPRTVLRWSTLRRPADQTPRRPQRAGITQIRRLPAGQRRPPVLSFGRNLRFFAPPRTTVEHRDRSAGRSLLMRC